MSKQSQDVWKKIAEDLEQAVEQARVALRKIGQDMQRKRLARAMDPSGLSEYISIQQYNSRRRTEHALGHAQVAAAANRVRREMGLPEDAR